MDSLSPSASGTNPHLAGNPRATKWSDRLLRSDSDRIWERSRTNITLTRFCRILNMGENSDIEWTWRSCELCQKCWSPEEKRYEQLAKTGWIWRSEHRQLNRSSIIRHLHLLVYHLHQRALRGTPQILGGVKRLSFLRPRPSELAQQKHLQSHAQMPRSQMSREQDA